MKAFFALASVTLLMSPLASAANGGTYYFSDGKYESARPVQIIGAPRSQENLVREDQVTQVIGTVSRSFRHCFEKALSQESLDEIQTTFFFEVSEQGLIQNITADLRKGNPESRAVRDLINCSALRMRTIQLPQSTSKQTFRFNLSFMNVR